MNALTKKGVRKVEVPKPKRPRRTGKPVGRPPSPDGDVTLHLRSTAAEREEWEAEAKLAGNIGVSTLVKLVMGRYLRDEKARRLRLKGEGGK